MPAMTANQIRMVLQIAAAYGEEIGVDRAVEILSVVGSAFAFRTLARQALSFVPGFGWVLKGAVGFSATMALGRATIAYFDAGAPLQVSHMKRSRSSGRTSANQDFPASYSETWPGDEIAQAPGSRQAPGPLHRR